MDSKGLKWDAKQWRERMEECAVCKDYAGIRNLRKQVFDNTVKVVETGSYLSENGKLVCMPKDIYLAEGSKLYKHKFMTYANALQEDTVVEVWHRDCLVVAKQLLDEELRPAVLIMASPTSPGGGVKEGAGAQEENLLRRTNLYLSLFQYAQDANQLASDDTSDHYPLDPNFGGVYTRQATVFRGTEDEGYPLLDEPYKVDFVAVPAMNRPEIDANGMIAEHLIAGVKKKIRTIFRIARRNYNHSLVLGAFGCGAFKNPPKHVAKLFHEVMEEAEFKNRFKKIAFAIIKDHNDKDDKNFAAFADEFGIKDCETQEHVNEYVAMNHVYFSNSGYKPMIIRKNDNGSYSLMCLTSYQDPDHCQYERKFLNMDFDAIVPFNSYDYEARLVVKMRDDDKWRIFLVEGAQDNHEGLVINLPYHVYDSYEELMSSPFMKDYKPGVTNKFHSDEDYRGCRICDSWTPPNILQLRSTDVFVFGSNLAGHHTSVDAKWAYDFFGARWGKGSGMAGQTYAIPVEGLSLEEVKTYVDKFIAFTKLYHHLHFFITSLECGDGGLTEDQLRPLFKELEGEEIMNVNFSWSYGWP